MNTDSTVPNAGNPVRLLLGAVHLKLLSLLLLRPSEDFHLRQIERITAVSAGTARRELQRFEQAGLVTVRRVGNQVRYQADSRCIVFAELAAMLRKTTGLADVLREALQPLTAKIDAAFIFGSAAEGREGPFSDIDLMIVGTPGFDEVVAAIRAPEEKVGAAHQCCYFASCRVAAAVEGRWRLSLTRAVRAAHHADGYAG
ncbi:MAG: nucleotidyltransferase domain-containing protein [Betaproteobacteria bacterium]|nr:nucleotidyltransferase domain-containing protein [Betaproteobacteria bacterium]